MRMSRVYVIDARRKKEKKKERERERERECDIAYLYKTHKVQPYPAAQQNALSI